MRLSLGFRVALCALFSVLLGTGVAWLLIDPLAARDAGGWRSTAPLLLALHGAAGMLVLLMLGALFVLHARPAWRRRLNRVSGAVMVTSNGGLIVTALGLYYVGGDDWRAWTSTVHLALGLAFPVLLVLHIALGRRAVGRLDAPSASP